MVDFVASHAGPLVCIKYQKYKLHGAGESSIKFSHAMAAMVRGKLQIWRWNALNGHAKQFLKPLRGSDGKWTSKRSLDVSGPGGYMIHMIHVCISKWKKE